MNQKPPSQIPIDNVQLSGLVASQTPDGCTHIRLWANRVQLTARLDQAETRSLLIALQSDELHIGAKSIELFQL